MGSDAYLHAHTATPVCKEGNMKNVLLALAVLASSGAVCAKEYRCDANGGVYYTSERVIDLPQDQNRWYVTVIGDPDNAQFRQITAWFNTHPELVQIARATHYSEMSTRSTMYTGRCNQSAQFAPPSTPCIRIQDQTGNVVYQVSGKNIPLSPEGLVNSMQATCFRRRQAAPAPSPYNYHYHFQVPDKQPEQQAVKPKEENQIEDVFNRGGSMIEIPVWAYFVIGILMVGVGVGVEWVKEYRKRA
jgi:hypothetical protein